MSENFAALLDESLNTLEMQPGTIVSRVVLDLDKEWVTVHVGLKSEGVIPLDEFKDVEGNVDINVGDEIEVRSRQLKMVMVKLGSPEKKLESFSWKNLEEALETGEFVTGKVLNRVKGGFSVEVDVIKAFLPGSLVDIRPVKEAPELENTIQEFKVIKLDYKRNNVVLSEQYSSKLTLQKKLNSLKILKKVKLLKVLLKI